MTAELSPLEESLLPQTGGMAQQCVHLPTKPAEFDGIVARTNGCAVAKCKNAVSTDVWICLTCGYAGCGRSGEKHAMSHYSMHRHPCVIHRSTTMVWCYECDAELVDHDGMTEEYVALLANYRHSASAESKTSKPSFVSTSGSTPSAAKDTPTTSTSTKLTAPSGKKSEDGRTPMLFAYPTTAGLTGLQNLGNTCFLNSCIQSLSNIPQLSIFLTECSFVSQQAKADSLAHAFRALMMEMWYRLHVGFQGRAVPPDELPWAPPSSVFRSLRRANIIFEGFQQHDAHEALRTILNEMHEKLAVDVPIGLYQSLGKVADKTTAAATRSFKGTGSFHKADSDDDDVDNGDADVRVDRAVGRSVRPRYSKEVEPPPDRKWLVDGPYTGPETVQRSIVSDLFQGIYCSRVRCKTCGTDSLTYDTFYDLSLPIPRSSHAVARGSDGSSHPARATSWAANTADAADSGDAYPDGFDAAFMSPTMAGTVPNVMRQTEGGGSEKVASVAEIPSEEAEESGGWFWDTVGKLFCSSRGGPRSYGIGLGDCLYNFFDWEELTGSDQYFCEVCKVKRDAQKRVSIVSLPEVLCIQLKRFSYQGWNGSKNSTTVHFPLSGLDMSPFLGVSAHAAAVRSYIAAKEQQVGTDLNHLLDAAVFPISATAAVNPMRTSSKPGPVEASSGAKGLSSRFRDGAEDHVHVMPSLVTHTPASRRKVLSTFYPETRALILHRHALTNGSTGVDAIAAAASAIAGTGLHHAVLPTDPSAGMDKSAHCSAAELAAATGAATSYLRASAALRAMTPEEATAACLSGPSPVPSARICSSVAMGDCKYDCVSLIQHMGGLGSGHYISHAKNRTSGKWYTFDDSTVYPRETADVQRREAYVLFYIRRRNLPCAKAVLPPANEDPVEFYISKYWWLRYSLVAVPGPITNADILCDHGAIKNMLTESLQNVVVGVTRKQYEALALAYGSSDKPLESLEKCRECTYEAQMLAHRRKRERDQIVAVDTTSLGAGEDSVWYLMSEWWLARWRAFINSDASPDGTGRGVLPPGPIDNARLLGKDGKPLPNLRSAVHYRGVNVHVWNFLHSIYGGGPPLRRQEIKIYAPDV